LRRSVISWEVSFPGVFSPDEAGRNFGEVVAWDAVRSATSPKLAPGSVDRALNGRCGSTHGKTTKSGSAHSPSTRTTLMSARLTVPPGRWRQIQLYMRVLSVSAR
jgi:hypothetical protein